MKSGEVRRQWHDGRVLAFCSQGRGIKPRPGQTKDSDRIAVAANEKGDSGSPSTNLGPVYIEAGPG